MNAEIHKFSDKSKSRTFLVFQVGGQRYGVPSGNVQQITPMAELHLPPGTPKLLAGFLNLEGLMIPVVCLHHLFNLPPKPVHLWTPLVVLRIGDTSLALLVDDIQQILRAGPDNVLPLMTGQVLNDCVEGIVQQQSGTSVLLLSAERLLLQKELESIAALQQLAQQRLCELDSVQA